MKEAFARVTVELAKQMWPQRWGSFVNDMDTLSKCGVSFAMHVQYVSPRWKGMCKHAVCCNDVGVCRTFPNVWVQKQMCLALSL